jgi:hypothetical protein
VEPVARRIFCGWCGVGALGGERASVRIAEVCAVKRKVSAKVTVLSEVSGDGEATEEVGKEAVMP